MGCGYAKLYEKYYTEDVLKTLEKTLISVCVARIEVVHVDVPSTIAVCQVAFNHAAALSFRKSRNRVNNLLRIKVGKD